ncbi:hypothetical protein MN116_008565 [Schistosoma mekongi]|uniref:EF-hand domain-containing protein n=1 Tax=Schistosoma mekongi TaxID=38744 RepID=A0AAE2D1E3_SCHME|nr:hypothetical protein MN116_008565 [Schistosoma mekongi]
MTNSPRGSKINVDTEDDDEKLMKDCHVSKKRISELREIFRFIDRDNDGTVSRQEFSTLIRLVSSEYTDNQIKLLMNKADMNGDGEMAFDEFVRLLSNESDAQEEVSATREAFEVFDTKIYLYNSVVLAGNSTRSKGSEFNHWRVHGSSYGLRLTNEIFFLLNSV